MSDERPVAAIDVGTNTVLLLIAGGSAKVPVALEERMTITRLGEGVDRTGRLSDAAMQRTVAALEDYAAVTRSHGVGSVDVVCTSAARDAANGSVFLALATRALGAAPRIIGGDEEARLTFDGALTGLGLEGDVAVFDVGGGSTEIIRGKTSATGAQVSSGVSLDIGSVRLTERHVRHDPPTPSELELLRADVRRALSDVPRFATTELVGVAGTVTTLASIHQGLSVYDSARVHGSTLARDDVGNSTASLAKMPLAERRRVKGLDPARADVIVAGAEIALAVLDWAGAMRLRVSDRGVRWGLARELLARSSR